MSAVVARTGTRPVLEVRDLHVEFATYGGTVKAVRSADLPDGALIAATFRSPA